MKKSPYKHLLTLMCKEQGSKKAMCLVGLFYGKVLGSFWVEGNMNREVYQEINFIHERWSYLPHNPGQPQQKSHLKQDRCLLAAQES